MVQRVLGLLRELKDEEAYLRANLAGRDVDRYKRFLRQLSERANSPVWQALRLRKTLTPEAAILGGLSLLAYAGVRWWRERRWLKRETSLLPFPAKR